MAAAVTPPHHTGPENNRDWLNQFIRNKTPEKIGAGYTLFVKFLRLILPIAALVLVGFLIIRLTGDDPNQPVMKDKALMPTQADSVMMDARYEGIDKDQRPYTITADEVTRSLASPGIVNMVHPMADITLQDQTWLAARADRGVYDQDNATLHLDGAVRLFHDQGYEMTTPVLDLDMANGEAWATQTVKGQGPKGLIVSKGLHVKNAGAHIVFKGPARLTLFSEGKK